MCGSDICLGIIAIVFPPLAVWVKRGICSADSFINLALCVLGFLPGLLHAWYIISAYPDPTYEEIQDPEGQRVTYYYVQQDGTNNGQRGYGTVNAAPGAQRSQFPGQQKGRAPPPQQYSQGEGMQGGSSSAATEVPPTYQEATGDHKVQSRE